MRYTTRATMFGDGANGLKFQAYEVLDEAGEEVGIVVASSKENHKAPWERRFVLRDGQEFGTLEEACKAAGLEAPESKRPA